jgi:DNA uptake protein ComE-like DNA-binding protein
MTTTPIRAGAAVVLLIGIATGCSEHRTRHYAEGRHERADKRLDLNSASRRDLARLPGLTTTDADRIIASRPFGGERGLVRKRVLTEAQYERVKDLVYVEQRDRSSDRD